MVMQFMLLNEIAQWPATDYSTLEDTGIK